MQLIPVILREISIATQVVFYDAVHDLAGPIRLGMFRCSHFEGDSKERHEFLPERGDKTLVAITYDCVWQSVEGNHAVEKQSGHIRSCIRRPGGEKVDTPAESVDPC